MLQHLTFFQKVESKPYYQKIKLVVGWQGMLVLGIVLGSLIVD